MIKKANQYGGNMEKIRMQSVNLQKANAVMAEVKKAVIGKDTCILKVMAAMIAGGHILLDDIFPLKNIPFHKHKKYKFLHFSANSCLISLQVSYNP